MRKNIRLLIILSAIGIIIICTTLYVVGRNWKTMTLNLKGISAISIKSVNSEESYIIDASGDVYSISNPKNIWENIFLTPVKKEWKDIKDIEISQKGKYASKYFTHR